MQLIDEINQRKAQLFEKISAQDLVVLPAAPEYFRNHDAQYSYRQDSDFYYMTGFDEPEAVIVFDGATNKTTLFNRTRVPAQEQWTGPRLGQECAPDMLGVDAAFPITEIDSRLPELLHNHRQVIYPVGRYRHFDEQVLAWREMAAKQVRAGKSAPSCFASSDDYLHEMRLIKSPFEIEKMRTAAEVSAQAHAEAMKACTVGQHEYELAAILHYEFERHGCQSPAYESIVGSGSNACVLHYVKNRAQMRDGDLVLIDAGAEYDGYAADITRTFPVNGKFTAAQAALYDLVLQAQLAAIEMIQPLVPWHCMQNKIIEVLTQGLVDLGILQGNVQTLIENKAYQPFYMHNSGHWLGMDVHDRGSYKKDNEWRPLEPGMVLTVEPGLYIAADAAVDEQWRGIGIRIEDDVLVTESGYDVLSHGVPKHRTDIEALMSK